MTAHENSCTPTPNFSTSFTGDKLIRTLVLLGVGCRRGAKQRHAHDVPDCREAVLGLGEERDAVAILAEVGVLGCVQKKDSGGGARALTL
jgi:hypothetical protein